MMLKKKSRIWFLVVVGSCHAVSEVICFLKLKIRSLFLVAAGSSQGVSEVICVRYVKGGRVG